MNIRFTKPYIKGNEVRYIQKAIASGRLSGGGEFSQRCHRFFEERYGYKKTLLTNSGTDALELAALLLEVEEDDEIIMPSFTFVSTANAFELRGAKIQFVDVDEDIPNIDPQKIEAAITDKTKAIVLVHYAGIACEMEEIMRIANKYNLLVVEDAAQAIDSYYKGKPLGSFGNVGILSFHETKNIISGEGGLCIINDERMIPRAEILWEKGTNRQAFFRGEVDKYTWIDVGSSYLPSELTASFLYAQLENLAKIQELRLKIWHRYHERLSELEEKKPIRLPMVPDYSSNNAHIFFFFTKDPIAQAELLNYLNDYGIKAIFHYIPLHSSPYFMKKKKLFDLPVTDRISQTIIRLPLYCELTIEEQDYIIKKIYDYFDKTV